jgi:hypothetical protein
VSENQISRTDWRPTLRFHHQWSGWVPMGGAAPQPRSLPREQALHHSSCQTSGGKDNPQMFEGFSSLVPQCRGWSGSTYTTSAIARLSVRWTRIEIFIPTGNGFERSPECSSVTSRLKATKKQFHKTYTNYLSHHARGTLVRVSDEPLCEPASCRKLCRLGYCPKGIE